jgi:hypothetical protein
MSDKNNGYFTLHENIWRFVMMFLWIVFKMIIVPDIICN